MSLREKRVHAYNRQNGRCYYCQWPIWERAFEPQDKALKRVNAMRSNKSDAVANLQSFECTAEHLERRVDGGGNVAVNIVAACRDCNSTRDQAKPDEWQHRRVIANRLDEAGQDKGFDPAFYVMPNIPLKEQYRFKWHHNFFVELPQWQVEIEAMRLGNFSRAGSAYRTASSIAIVYPLFANEADFNRPTQIYAGHKEIPGAQIMLENPEHEAILRSVFRSAVVK